MPSQKRHQKSRRAAPRRATARSRPAHRAVAMRKAAKGARAKTPGGRNPAMKASARRSTRAAAPVRTGGALPIKKGAALSGKDAKPGKPGLNNALWCAKLLGDAQVRRWLVENIGENAIHVIREFGVEMTDEEIAGKTGVRSSDVRVVLNRLHSHGLAQYARSRDKNSGWYSYVWRLDEERAHELSGEINPALLAEGERTTVSAVVGVEEGERYHCRTCPQSVVGFEAATHSQFRCGRCGSSLDFFEGK